MQAKIYTQLEAIFNAEGYNVNPNGSDIKNASQLPLVWFAFPDDEMDVTVEDDEQEVSHLINTMGLDLRIVLESNNENYRIKCLEELSNIKRIINEQTQIISPVFGCLARKWDYESAEILNFNTDRLASGGIEVRTNILYSQLRSDPTNN